MLVPARKLLYALNKVLRNCQNRTCLLIVNFNVGFDNCLNLALFLKLKNSKINTVFPVVIQKIMKM